MERLPKMLAILIVIGILWPILAYLAPRQSEIERRLKWRALRIAVGVIVGLLIAVFIFVCYTWLELQ